MSNERKIRDLTDQDVEAWREKDYVGFQQSQLFLLDKLNLFDGAVLGSKDSKTLKYDVEKLRETVLDLKRLGSSFYPEKIESIILKGTNEEVERAFQKVKELREVECQYFIDMRP